MPPKKLLDRVREILHLKHYSRSTEKTYVFWINCLFMVRKHIWQIQVQNYVIFTPDDDIIRFTPDILDLLLMLGYP